jgi:hypothetical protein
MWLGGVKNVVVMLIMDPIGGRKITSNITLLFIIDCLWRSVIKIFIAYPSDDRLLISFGSTARPFSHLIACRVVVKKGFLLKEAEKAIIVAHYLNDFIIKLCIER